MATGTNVSLVFTLTSDVGDLIEALRVFQALSVNPRHIESRASVTPGRETGSLDYYVQCDCPEAATVQALRKGLETVCFNVDVHFNSQPATDDEVPWFPRSVHELHHCCTALIKYGSELAPDHPGFGDGTYVERRKQIAEIALNYKYGSPIPRVRYTEKETETWGEVFRNQTGLYPTHACREYNQQYPELFAVCGYREDNIPQLEDVSQYLRARTGWQLWPVLGWISSRDFLAALAFRTFPSSQYIRHHSSPFYTPEPDICHELMGHVPLFCDPVFAQFSQEIGLASLGASEEWVKKLSTLYWFTVEFGMVREDGKSKAFGAGLLSGNKELQYCISDEPQCKNFDIETAAMQTYPETGLQPLYFVAESMEDMRNKMVEYAKTIPRPFSLSYDPTTQCVEVLDSGCRGSGEVN